MIAKEFCALHFTLINSEIGQGMVIHLNAPTDPAVSIMILGQPCNRPCTPHGVQRGVQP